MRGCAAIQTDVVRRVSEDANRGVDGCVRPGAEDPRGQLIQSPECKPLDFLRYAHPCARWSGCADCLDSQTVRQKGVVPHLVYLGGSQLLSWRLLSA